MTDIDKAVELARETVGAVGYDEDRVQRDLFDLARAVLAMAQVVEAAREMTAARIEAPIGTGRWSAAIRATEAAIRTLDAEARRG